MVFLFPVALGLLVVSNAVQATIQQVDPKTIETRGSGALFVEFFQPNCASCEELTTQVEQIASKYRKENTAFVRINCDDYKGYCRDKHVEAFPAFLASLDRGPWKRLDPNQQTLEEFVEQNKPYRNTKGESKSITTREEIEAIVKSKEPWFIKFYAPWCGHCQTLAGEWVMAASRLKDKVNVGEVNCESNKDLCNEHKVTGLPTLKYFIHGTSIQFHGERKADALVEFALEHTGSAVRGVRRDQLFDDLLKKSDVNLVYVTEKQTKEHLEQLEQIAPSYLQSIPFYTTSDPSSAQRFGLSNLPAIVILKDNQQFVYDGHQDLSAWIKNHSKPLVTTIYPHNSREILKEYPGLVVLGLFNPTDTSSHEAFRHLSAQCQRDDILFAQLDAWEYAPFVSRSYGINLVHLPAVVILDSSHQQYFKTNKDEERFDVQAHPQEILDSLDHLDTLTPISTVPPKLISYAANAVNYIMDYWVLFSSGAVALLALLVILLAVTGNEQETPKKKKE
ncbi:hypothetical protein CU097_010794 [Rhizopus azygosporus]|uniref:Thioredoxin domain-containing protein n=1 Tax=Rhizopus azygosporus TaxID=86630 RepID=A0A367JV00_RHIAZ|nr:hypothetical protein CU097_010794 [Rhizopus azygosporus]